MELSFLKAEVPLTKTYRLVKNELIKEPYPHVKNFSSMSVEVESLEEMYDLVKSHAEQNNCLLKGVIRGERLDNEPRAGKTDSIAPTQWICLDIDGLPGITNPDSLLAEIPCLKDVSYISQASSSMGVEPEKGLSYHLFLMLDRGHSPQELKEWLMHLNMTVPLLYSNIHLNAAKTTLKWPLDISTCQNDKLLYIAPPILVGKVKDHYDGDRITLIQKNKSTAVIPSFSFDTTGSLKLFNRFRAEADLPQRRKSSTRLVSGFEILNNAGTAQVTDIREDRGFVYLNLNGGDSFGYYHPADNKEVLFNFKGEPNYSIKELLPEYYKGEEEAKEAKGIHYLSLIDKKTDAYYKGAYNYDTESLELNQTSSLRKLIDYLKQHGQPSPDFIPEWNIGYDFESDKVFDPENKWINRYQKSIYLRRPKEGSWEIIKQVIDHVLGYNPEVIEYFLNWLAVIIQQRKMTGTAWILHGTQGTGKGVLFNQILSPIIGHDYVNRCHLTSFEGEFNSFIESSLLVLVDEVQISELHKRSMAMSRIKQYIVEPEIPIRRMYCNPYIIRNTCNYIFASNKHDPVEIDPEDRRFNVALRQNIPLLKAVPVSSIKAIPSELAAFAFYLLNRPANRHLAATPMDTYERTRLQELTRDVNESILDHLISGNLQFFVDNKPDSESDMKMELELASGMRKTLSYDAIIDEAFATKGEPSNIPRNHLEVIYYYISGISFKTRHKFTKFLNYKGLDIKSISYGGNTVKGIHNVEWKITPELEERWEEHKKVKNNVDTVP